MVSEQQASGCYRKALQLLARRPHFRRELAAKLQARKFPPEEIESILDVLEERKLLDDRQNALEMAQGPFSRKGFGPRRVLAELLRRGVGEDLAAETVREVYPDTESELSMARKLSQARVRRGAVDREALARHLDRHGYSKAVVFRILAEFSEHGSDQ